MNQVSTAERINFTKRTTGIYWAIHSWAVDGRIDFDVRIINSIEVPNDLDAYILKLLGYSSVDDLLNNETPQTTETLRLFEVGDDATAWVLYKVLEARSHE